MKIDYSVPPAEFHPVTFSITVESLVEYFALRSLSLKDAGQLVGDRDESILDSLWKAFAKLEGI